MPEIDIVIISYAKNHLLKKMTVDCLNSLFRSDNAVEFNAIVVESNSNVDYDMENVTTIYPDEPFGYHKYLNIGRKQGNGSYVCLCNNDLIFENDWAIEIIKAMKKDPQILSASPYCRNSHPHYQLKPRSGIREGYQVRKFITGWCIFQQRKIYDIIGDLDEDFTFWYADNDYGETLKLHQVKHALVTNSIVTHMTSKTLMSTRADERRLLTRHQKAKFDRKWNGIHAMK